MDPERILALDAFCTAAGLAGCWSDRGPTERAQLLARRRWLDNDGQRFALALAFRAWRGEGPSPEAIEVLALDGETLDALALLAHRWNGRPPR